MLIFNYKQKRNLMKLKNTYKKNTIKLLENELFFINDNNIIKLGLPNKDQVINIQFETIKNEKFFSKLTLNNNLINLVSFKNEKYESKVIDWNSKELANILLNKEEFYNDLIKELKRNNII